MERTCRSACAGHDEDNTKSLPVLCADRSIRRDHQEYYSGFANSVLWPILHYRIDLAEFTRRDLSGYLRINQHFAKVKGYSRRFIQRLFNSTPIHYGLGTPNLITG